VIPYAATTQDKQMTEITGEVDYKEIGQMQPPGLVRPPQNDSRYIPVLKLRLLIPDGRIVQVLFKGDIFGDANIGDEVEMEFADREIRIHPVKKKISKKADEVWQSAKGSWKNHPVFGNMKTKEIIERIRGSDSDV